MAGVITPFGELPERLARGMSMAEQHEWLTRRVSRRAVLAAGVATPLLWSQPARAASAAGVYGTHLTYGADPRTSMIVAFAVAGPFRAAAVRVRGADGAERTEPAQVATVPGATARYCRSTFTGLRPGTAYAYEVVLDGVVAVRSTLRTAPATPGPFRFTAFGDQSTGHNAKALLRRVGELAPMLHLVAGDICYADSSGAGRPSDLLDQSKWDLWLTENSPLARTTPYLCAMGNHEMEPGFGLHGYAGVVARVPIGGQSPIEVPVASRFQVGNVGFVSLDSNDVSYEIPANRGWTGGAQTAWLARTLAAWRAPHSGVDFVVAFLHHSPYSLNYAHGSEGGIREAWVPLFDRYSVDLVIAGHNHCYERTRPLRAGKVTAHDAHDVDSRRGTTYITAGGGGQVATPGFHHLDHVMTGSGQVQEPAPWSLPTRTTDHAVVCVDVDAAAMHVRVIDIAGRTIDAVTLRHGSVPAPAPALSGDGTDELTPWLVGGGTAVGVAALATGLTLRRRARPAQPRADRNGAGR